MGATIAKTRDKKDCLLKVLAHPETLLHNSPAELGARARVRKRDASFGPRTPDGTRAWDTFMSLAETARKVCLRSPQSLYPASRMSRDRDGAVLEPAFSPVKRSNNFVAHRRGPVVR